MAMNGTNLGNEIWTEIRPYLDWDGDNPPATITGQDFWIKVATKIVAHVSANAKATGTDTPQGNSHILDIA